MKWYSRINTALASALCVSLALSPVVLNAANREEASEPSPLQEWSQGNRHFTTTIYPHLKATGHNVIYSPYSLQSALSMAAVVAQGDTLSQIIDAACLPESTEVRDYAMKTLLERLNTGAAIGVEPVGFHSANSAWLSSDIIFSPGLTSRLLESYSSLLQQVDFKDTENARFAINQWVNEETLGYIPELLSQGTINPLTNMVLVNALFFKAPWDVAFPEENSHEAVFYGLEKSLRPIPFIRKQDKLGFRQEAYYSVVEVPFKESKSTEDKFSLVIVMPNEGVRIDQVEKHLSTRRLSHWMEDADTRLVDISLPKFKVSQEHSLKDALKNMGMTDAFSEEKADFGFADEHGKVIITDVIQKVVFEIDEQGGTGAAATGISFGTTSFEEPIPFVANRPFLFFVVEKTTGVVVFAGRMMQPKLD